MREWDKMLAGELYDPADAELKAGREMARALLFALQQLPPSAKEQRQQLWQQLLGSAKGEPAIHLPFHCDYGRNIHLGARFYANAGCTILDVATVTIGDDVLFGINCSINVGAVIGNHSRFAPGTVIEGTIADGTVIRR